MVLYRIMHFLYHQKAVCILDTGGFSYVLRITSNVQPIPPSPISPNFLVDPHYIRALPQYGKLTIAGGW